MEKRGKQSHHLHSLLRKRAMVSSKDLTGAGIHHETLRRMKLSGDIMQIGRGAYISAQTELSENFSLALLATKAPSGVICLLSALQFHGIGTQMPFEVWVALPRGTRTPRLDKIPIRAIRTSGQAFTAGVETHTITGVQVKVYSAAKTVADCFKHRNKIGLDVALEALRDVWRHRLCTADELWKYAVICRVSNVMLPYLESLG